jgi:non-ribosomal peptide synthetase component E (peptide arylation enzyme)
MDPIEKRELKRKAWMRLAAQKRRAGVLRGRVVVMSLICFVVLWGVVFAQMATGNDPVLSGKVKAVATRAAASPRREIETTDPREVEPEIEEEVEPEPLVTSQS